MTTNSAVVKSKGLTPAQQNILDFNNKINGNYVQTQLKNVLGKNAGTFATSLIEVFSNDTQLQNCDPNKVVQEAIKAATLKLPLNKQLGYAYIVVFNNWDKVKRCKVATPTLTIGYRGYIQMAMRTGQYRNINADVVYEGELVGRDKLSGQIDLSGERTSDKIEGFFAHFETIDGFRKTLYMSLPEMASYALKFSPSFKRKATAENPLPTVDNLCDLANQQAQNGSSGKVGWEGDFLSMGTKTVLRRLLSKYGYLSIENMGMMTAINEDDRQTSADVRDEEFEQAKEVVVIDSETGEVTQSEAPASAPDAPQAEPKDNPFNLD